MIWKEKKSQPHILHDDCVITVCLIWKEKKSQPCILFDLVAHIRSHLVMEGLFSTGSEPRKNTMQDGGKTQQIKENDGISWLVSPLAVFLFNVCAK